MEYAVTRTKVAQIKITIRQICSYGPLFIRSTALKTIRQIEQKFIQHTSNSFKFGNKIKKPTQIKN